MFWTRPARRRGTWYSQTLKSQPNYGRSRFNLLGPKKRQQRSKWQKRHQLHPQEGFLIPAGLRGGSQKETWASLVAAEAVSLHQQCSRRGSQSGWETGTQWPLGFFQLQDHSMISSIFNGLFVCDSHWSPRKDQIVSKHSSVIPGCTQRAPWTTGTVIWGIQQNKQTNNTPAPEIPSTPSPKAKKNRLWLPDQPNCQWIPGSRSSLGLIWRVRIWLLRQTHFHTFSLPSLQGQF